MKGLSLLFAAVLLGLSGSLSGAQLPILELTSVWRYDTNDLTAAGWEQPGYDDASWPSGPALLYIEENQAVAPRNTPLPTCDGTQPCPTYYFRTSFNFTNDPAGAVLAFSCRVDDGAVFYLNGAEVQRLRMPPGAIAYSTAATSPPPYGDAVANEFFTIAPTNLLAGTNVLAVEVHQFDPASSDIVFGTAVSQAFSELKRGPYLQLGTPTSIVIRWRTDIPTDSQITYGTNLASLECTNASGVLTTEHQVQLAGLSAGTRYFYSVGSRRSLISAARTDQYFITSPPPGTPKHTRIWVIGDAGTAGRGYPWDTANQMAVRDAYYALSGTNHTDLWLQLGDNAYDNGTDAQFQAGVFDIYASLLRTSVTWPTLGNHDTDQAASFADDYPYFAMFSLPTVGEAGGAASGTAHYYSFDYANIHLICLDSMTASRSPTGAMALWLQADLQANTNQWILAYWHHPPYSKGSHDSDSESRLIEMRQNLLPLLEAYGVDLVLCGHSHSYERSYLLDGHYGASATLAPAMILNAGNGREDEPGGAYVKPRGYGIANRGAVYAVAGSSGQTSGGSFNHPVMCVNANALGSMLIEIFSNRLDALFLRETGATNDHFTLLKQNFPPVASNLNFTIGADTPAQLALAGSDINRDPIRFATTNAPSFGLLSGPDPTNGLFTYTPARGSTNTDTFQFSVSDGSTSSAPATVTIAIAPPPDTNANGLADDWEARFGVADPSADDDQDGMTNLQEYWAGTNPRDSNSWLRVSSPTAVPGGGALLTWLSAGGVRYRVLFSDGDATGGFNGLFTPLARPVAVEMDPSPPGTASSMSFKDDFSLTGSPQNGNRYYRIQVVQ